MKKTFLCFLILAALYTTLQAQVRFVNTENFRPFIPMFDRLFAEAGLTVTYVFAPIPRGIELINQGDADASCFLTEDFISKIPTAIRLEPPVLDVELMAVCTKASISIKTVKDLARYKVGIIRGNPSMRSLTRDLPDVQEATTVDTLMKMLGAGRFEVAILGRKSIVPAAEAAGLGEWFVQEPPLVELHSWFVLGKDSSRFKDLIEPVLKRWIESGRFAAEFAAAWKQQGQS